MTKIRSWNKISKKYQIKLCNNNLENAEILIENDLMEYKNRYFFESVKIIASNINVSHKKNNRYQMVSVIFWCERRDLNPYESPHTPLKRARLPIPPLSRQQLAL